MNDINRLTSMICGYEEDRCHCLFIVRLATAAQAHGEQHHSPEWRSLLCKEPSGEIVLAGDPALAVKNVPNVLCDGPIKACAVRQDSSCTLQLCRQFRDALRTK